MSRSPRSHYRLGLGWILGIAFEDTLTRPIRLAQEFTLVRCHGLPRASSPHRLAAPADCRLTTSLHCVQLPLARGCYQLAPRRTYTSNPVPMPGTPSATASKEEPNDPFIEDFSNEVMCMSYLYSKLPETGVSPHIGTGGGHHLV